MRLSMNEPQGRGHGVNYDLDLSTCRCRLSGCVGPVWSLMATDGRAALWRYGCAESVFASIVETTLTERGVCRRFGRARGWKPMNRRGIVGGLCPREDGVHGSTK